MNKKMMSLTAVTTILLAMSGTASAEECVAGVRALVPWSSNIPTSAPTNGAATMISNASARGYSVNHSASGCSSTKPCLLVYPTNYGNGISTKYGHVAALYSSTSPYKIADSNGICGGNRKSCSTAANLTKAWVIHPK